MVPRLTYLVASLALLLGPAWGFAARANDSQKTLEEFLREHGASAANVSPVTDDYVRNTFPAVDFFGVWFRQFPVAREVPKGFAASNLALVFDGAVSLFTEPAQLQGFFGDVLGPVTNEDLAADAGRTYLRLTQEFSRDGFFAFSDPRVAVFVFGEVIFVYGETLVTAGGRGRIAALLVFDLNGGLLDVFERRRVVEGPRPICQATKLLDSDPIVRKMAEQALLYMGPAAKDYLDEQRAKASPELKQAIDRIWKRIQDQER